MRQGYTVFAALVATSLLATPMVMGAANALATSDGQETVTQAVAVTPVEVAPVANSAAPEVCNRKVRVVYSGYITGPAACIASER
ncbi:hypothetical protein [Methylobacterium gnaphalii]|uniref:Porin n=1 Tax=Methylobacterium gnaphalii TaxID=1010610 RepID=A0A512JLP4_9HYPH|nr:hypothetical protein [Methylobacterium gnaphalii]GEP10876.1 hypothetical protein MGN01_27210 [Methylobacterium gnaphalii]GJD70746.1 hypothetical protein MMMDOFMJ_3699 [Methylobacterium gnaphalii]GLS50678.1 hypothetical protein GCM10007885_35320 [Methylobacterium gnaphalii]